MRNGPAGCGGGKVWRYYSKRGRVGEGRGYSLSGGASPPGIATSKMFSVMEIRP